MMDTLWESLTAYLGMFLWVRLVLSTLEDIFCEQDVREAVATLPQGLEAMYVLGTSFESRFSN